MNACRNFRSNPCSVAFAIALRFCLISSLWQAPVPWLHRHGSSVSESESAIAAQELNAHLVAYHSAFELRPDDDLGWHCHWILPSWKHGCDKTPAGERPIEQSCAFDLVTVCPIQTACVDSLLAAPMFNVDLLPLRRISGLSSGLSRQPLDVKSPRETLSVLRC